jgi:hypothetical protein
MSVPTDRDAEERDMALYDILRLRVGDLSLPWTPKCVNALDSLTPSAAAWRVTWWT